MDYVAKSRFSGDDACQTTLLAEAMSVRRTPILGTVLYDRQSVYQRIRDYMPIETDFPQIFARHIPQAILTNQFIVHKDDAIFVDSSYHVVRSNGADAPAIFETFAATLQQCDGTVDQRYADVSAMVFHNEGGGTWGHFIVQNLPRALLYLTKFPNGKIVLPSYHAIPDATNFNRSLVQLGVPQDRLLPVEPLGSYQFGELILVDSLYDIPKQIAHPLALDFLAASVAPTDAPDEDRSIFVSRLPAFGRSIDNVAEVSAVASNHGVKTVLLGEQHFDAQRAAWQHSDLVVSTLGSDLTNIVFGKEGTQILALSPDWFGDEFFYNLAVMKGMQWNELRCGTRVQDANVPHKASFRVDTAILDVMLTSLTPMGRP